MKAIYCIFLFSFPCLSQTRQTAEQKKPSPVLTNQQMLSPTFNHYHSKTIQIEVEQEIFLSSIKTSMKSQGLLNIKGNLFHLKLEGSPPSLMVFDGKSLWYQADTDEKVVFQLKNPSQIQVLTSFFDEDLFFKSFLIKQSQKTGQGYVFQLVPTKNIEGLSEIFMKVHSHITEIRIIWNNLNNWQKYKLSKPTSKKLPARLFQFSTDGFQLIKKD